MKELIERADAILAHGPNTAYISRASAQHVRDVVRELRNALVGHRNGVIEECCEAIGNLRQAEAGDFNDPKCQGAIGVARSDALHDAYTLIRKLKHG